VNPRKYVYGLVLVGVLLASSVVRAQTRFDVINGATCIEYPPYTTSTRNAVPYQFWLYGGSGVAYCHLMMRDDRSLNDLLYVLFSGSVSGDLLRARLCVYTTYSLAVTCGTERTISSGGFINWVVPPGSMPSSAFGAYVFFRFPSGRVSIIRQLIPVWSN